MSGQTVSWAWGAYLGPVADPERRGVTAADMRADTGPAVDRAPRPTGGRAAPGSGRPAAQAEALARRAAKGGIDYRYYLERGRRLRSCAWYRALRRIRRGFSRAVIGAQASLAGA